MKALKFILPVVLAAVLGGCAVYGPPVVYDQPYPPPGYPQPVYVAPQPVYVQPAVSFGFSYRGGRRWHGHHH